MKNILEINNISFQYKKDESSILENINLSFKPSEMVAIIGPSGIGKSTLFKLIVRNKKPTSGVIKINDQDISTFSKKHWKNQMQQIGFLTQEPNLIETEDVYTNIKRSIFEYKNWFFKLVNFLTLAQRTKIFQTLDDLEMLDKAFYKIIDLSGGQKQRVEITKLLIKNAKIILADEPTSNLDYLTAKDVLAVLRQLTKEKNLLTIVNIHDLSLVKDFFDRIIILNDKNVILDRSTKGIELCDIENMIKKTI
ncbi:ABC transporter ATP-binding protein [Mycoplasmopsis californica]|uniref:ATP-binding cassette domain-containing protein n=1 Tax=Mycoplasmopsis equigenitalium TaxID=114883 RepID=A0ABY5J1L8_9BACT|nr:ATP-binding cassette domain-containing protein [Mycoplasmopsis equigenitalium]UUD37145.1 ATP-binding cassette domain-containing protein [Mycoplasmopsis equigenitalium]VEU69550.1 ABC transporter ATP-binding protein [Mycoplasmopsis californica]